MKRSEDAVFAATNVFNQGEHICALYDSEEEQIAIAADYLADGLRRGERCYYVAASKQALQQFRSSLYGTGIDVTAALNRQALIEATHEHAHLAGGAFDCEGMLRRLSQMVEDTLAAGFTGLRTCGDMSWLIGQRHGCQHVVEYEALLNQFFHGVAALGMCQYDRRRLPADVIEDALATHSSVVEQRRHYPNPLYRPHPRSI